MTETAPETPSRTPLLLVTGMSGAGKASALKALEDIGFAPREFAGPGLFTKGDVGVIFSDPGGSRNVLRAYYANSDTAIVNDIPSESRLEPHRWGVVEVTR